MRVHWFMRVSACLQRDVATQVGMQFRNARVAHEARPPSLTPSEGLLTGRNRGWGEARRYQEGTRWNSLDSPSFFSRLRLCTSSSPLPSFFLHRLLCLSLLFPSFHRIIPNTHAHAHMYRRLNYVGVRIQPQWPFAGIYLHTFLFQRALYTVFEQEILEQCIAPWRNVTEAATTAELSIHFQLL